MPPSSIGTSEKMSQPLGSACAFVDSLMLMTLYSWNRCGPSGDMLRVPIHEPIPPVYAADTLPVRPVRRQASSLPSNVAAHLNADIVNVGSFEGVPTFSVYLASHVPE